MAANTRGPRETAKTLPLRASRHTVLGLNPACLSETTRDLVAGWSRSTSPPVPVLKISAAGRPAGWLIPVVLPAKTAIALPPDLAACIRLSLAKNCAYVRIDPIFAVDPDLPDYGP